MKKNQFSFFTVAPYMKTLESKREKITVEMSTVYFTLAISREPPRSSETAAIMADNTMATRLMIKEKIATFPRNFPLSRENGVPSASYILKYTSHLRVTNNAVRQLTIPMATAQ